MGLVSDVQGTGRSMMTSQAQVALWWCHGHPSLYEAEEASPALWELFAYLEGEKWTGKQEWLNTLRLFVCKYEQSCGVCYAATRRIEQRSGAGHSSLQAWNSSLPAPNSRVIAHVNTSCPSWHSLPTDWALRSTCLTPVRGGLDRLEALWGAVGFLPVLCSRGLAQSTGRQNIREVKSPKDLQIPFRGQFPFERKYGHRALLLLPGMPLFLICFFFNQFFHSYLFFFPPV